MNHYTIFIFLCLLLNGCQQPESNIRESISDNTSRAVIKTNSLEVAEPIETKKPDDDSLKTEISKVATSFHTWYIDATNNDDQYTPLSPEVVQDTNGKCKLDYEPYFGELTRLKTISEKFMKSEIERTSGCAEHLATIEWTEYVDADAYDYDVECPHMYYMYWTKSQDVFSGVSIDSVVNKSSKWLVTLAFYIDFDERQYYRHYQPVVTVENEAGKWMITKIEWIENK